jgi:pyrimidine operon attenuation protein/uracil phosphoribosyltransferase
MEQYRTILNPVQFQLVIRRLCFELIENYDDFSNAVIIGLQPRGKYLANRIAFELEKMKAVKNPVQKGFLDVTFYRDDFRRRDEPITPSKTEINFIIENKRVILIDDVLFTGRTIRAGLDAMLAFGRPEKVELLTLIDRRYSRDLPIQPDYVGKKIDSIISQRVLVKWQETDNKDEVILYTPKQKN